MKFLLEPDGILKYYKSEDINTLETEFIDENVLIYDFKVDKSRNVHLVYLQRNGDLCHVVFNESAKSESKIAKFDMLSNNYYQLSILIVKDNLNIFYAYSNKINSNLYALHHVILNGNKQEMYNIVRFVSKKNNRSFVADSDSSGKIHIFYNTASENYSYIFYTYFNPYKNQWLQNPVLLSTSEKKSEYPCILVDSKDNIHSIWWERSIQGNILKYKKMNQTGKELYKWQDINIPRIVQEYPYSDIYEEKNNLFIQCNEITISSSDSGFNWVVEDTSGDNSIFEDLKVQNIVLENNVSDEEDIADNLVNDLIEDKEEAIDENTIKLEQLLEVVDNINHSISQILDNQLLLNSKLDSLDEQLKNPPARGLKRFFTS